MTLNGRVELIREEERNKEKLGVTKREEKNNICMTEGIKFIPL